MILDKIENLGQYKGISPYIEQIISYLASHHLASQPEGRVELSGQDLYVNFDTAHGKNREEAVLESHNRMIDLQMVLDTDEWMGWSPKRELPQVPYSSERDISFYPGITPQQYIHVWPGDFVIFFPGDAHAPCITPTQRYHKVVFKFAYHE